MERLVADHQDEIAALCRRFRVRRLELFGSAATGSFDPASSDVDFLVEFAELRPGEWADAYFGLKERLEALRGRPVDLVMPSAVTNPYLLRAIEAGRTQPYAAWEPEVPLRHSRSRAMGYTSMRKADSGRCRQY